MTIPESVQLIIRAGSLARTSRAPSSSSTWATPYSIQELAEQMIRLSGLEPEKDIAIDVIGRRPGEKVHEDLYNPYERPAAHARGEDPPRRAAKPLDPEVGRDARSGRSTCSSSRATPGVSPDARVAELSAVRSWGSTARTGILDSARQWLLIALSLSSGVKEKIGAYAGFASVNIGLGAPLPPLLRPGAGGQAPA